jgi:serine protease inhibitor
MITRFALLTALLVCLWIAAITPAVWADETASDHEDEVAKRLSDAHNRFGFKLFNQILSTDFGENIFISPASAAFALAMLYNGAKGTTRVEMTKTLELTGVSLEDVNDANASLLASLNEGDSSVELAVANSIWYRDTFQFRQEFLDRTSQYYQAEIEALDFDDPGAVDIINGWVTKSTREKISNIIDEINPLDVMFLINAVYFKGAWTHPFPEGLTIDRAFHLLDGATLDVPMMQHTEGFRYLETDTFQAIRLPYGEGSFSMYLFLPAEDFGLKRFIDDVNPSSWTKWQGRFQTRQVNIVMPRYKLEYGRSFTEPLMALGMKTAFDKHEADLTALWNPMEVNTLNLYVGFVRQKTFLEVNEEGTEAAAVTAVGIVNFDSMPLPPIEMVVDRPFFCAIVDDTSGLILFMGAIVNPA